MTPDPAAASASRTPARIHRSCEAVDTGGNGGIQWDRVTMRKLDPEERQVAKLELMAAAAIFLVAAIVLYMVFYYRPA